MDLPRRRDSSSAYPAVVRRYGMSVSLKVILPISILHQLTLELQELFSIYVKSENLEREARLELAKTGFADRRFDHFSISRIWHTREDSNPESQAWNLLPSPSGRVCVVG